MAIATKPKRDPTATAHADPMAFIHGAEPRHEVTIADPAREPPKRKRKEPVIIRFDDDTLHKVDRAASKRGLSRAALVRMLVIENLPE